MINIYIGQALGVLATLITFLSYQFNTKRGVLLANAAATLSTCLSYLFLGANTGFVLNIVCILRNVIFFLLPSESRGGKISAALLALLMIVLGALSWQGPASLLIIVALATNTVFLSLGKPQALRYSILLTSSLILVYNIFVFSIGGMVNEGVAITSALIGIIRFRRTLPSAPVPDADRKKLP